MKQLERESSTNILRKLIREEIKKLNENHNTVTVKSLKIGGIYDITVGDPCRFKVLSNGRKQNKDNRFRPWILKVIDLNDKEIMEWQPGIDESVFVPVIDNSTEPVRYNTNN